MCLLLRINICAFGFPVSLEPNLLEKAKRTEHYSVTTLRIFCPLFLGSTQAFTQLFSVLLRLLSLLRLFSHPSHVLLGLFACVLSSSFWDTTNKNHEERGELALRTFGNTSKKL